MLNKQEVIQYASNHTLKECAKHFNKNIKTMSSYLHYNNITFRKELNNYTKQEIEQIALFVQEHTLKESAKHFGISVKAMEHLVNRRKITHKTERVYLGQSGTRLYRIYKLMKDRCNNPNNPKYKDYGGRNIELCSEWQQSYKAFHYWAINNGYKENLTIDRIDVNKGYYPENCRWLPFSQQGLNKRNTIKITYKGITKPLVVWAKELNIPYARLLYQYHHKEDLTSFIDSFC